MWKQKKIQKKILAADVAHDSRRLPAQYNTLYVCMSNINTVYAIKSIFSPYRVLDMHYVVVRG